ncbi:MAG TPA: DUF3303 family protein [Miltoncostaeaceae bacterium]|nr:DUF3303 family protein [Miltoncostaeaceae bacterium]
MSTADPGLTPDPVTAPAPGPGSPDGASLLLHVRWTAFPSIHRIEDVAHLQRTVIAVMERIATSPRTRAHGMFADGRGGFALVEIARPTELLELFAGLADVATLEVHPVAETADALRHLRGLLVTEDLIG